MKNFERTSLIGGWVVFLIALVTYTLTLEPTASLWDCSEFIATSYKLEVGHPPGTPLFFLINRLGAMFAPGVENVAYAINFLSGLESALTIALMFWSIVLLGKMIYRKGGEMTVGQQWSLIVAGAIGSLAYAFSDTFWFSAVEAEVYALSSLFTAAVFWAMLKWEAIADKPHSSRWLILIAYLMGLSIGAHILNLLAIPALAFIYYFKKYPGRKKKQLWMPAVVAVLMTGAFYILTPTVVSMGAWVDRVFVNSFSLPVNSGVTTFVLLLLGALLWGAWAFQKKMRFTMHMILLSAAMVVIGFSSYGIVLLRSSVNPPMNSNAPSNPYALVSLINRDQYGSNPLLKGETFNSVHTEYAQKSTYRINEQGKYEPLERLTGGGVYDPATTVFFPRMHSPQSSHIREYKNWSGIKAKEEAQLPWGRKVISETGQQVTLPTFGENIKFFFSYQMNHMYWRYFLWNFAGRQSDIQSQGNIDNGQWLSGITPLDELYLGPQSGLPDEMAANRGHNTYFFLPLILGLIGLFYQLTRDGKGWWVVFILFFMTGIAIILYLNQPPLQPRERDYAFAGSFYAFAIWIGIGAMQLYDAISKKIKNGKLAAALTFVVCATVPGILAQQNWDDHDRSNRTLARDMGINYLNTTLPNGILINYGDNDAFPVWYAQEVEGVRTDVRPMNFSYILSDWYTEQMRIKANESDPVPFTIPRSKYREDSPRLFVIDEKVHPKGGVWTAKEVMEIIASDAPQLKFNGIYDIIPARRIAVPVNKENALKSGIIQEKDLSYVVDTIFINIPDKRKRPEEVQTVNIDDVLLIDLLANFDWKRPLHFTSLSSMQGLGLLSQTDSSQVSYLQNDGALYRLVPIRSEFSDPRMLARIDTETLYDNLMNKYNYGGLKKGVYTDTFYHNTLYASQFRSSFANLAKQLVAEGDKARAIQVLDKAMTELPVSQLRYDMDIQDIVEAYWLAGEKTKGDKLAEAYAANEAQYINYFKTFTGRKVGLVNSQLGAHYYYLYNIVSLAQQHGDKALVDKYVVYLKDEPKYLYHIVLEAQQMGDSSLYKSYMPFLQTLLGKE